MIPLRYNIRSLVVRRTTSLATLIGIGLVVLILAAALMLTDGIDRTLAASGHPDRAIVMRKGADAEMASSIAINEVGQVLAAPGVKIDAAGKPIGSAENVKVIALNKIGGKHGEVSNVFVRGVAENVMALRPEVRLIKGRPAKPGTDEVIIGKSLRGRFAGTEIDQQFELKKNRPMTVVGVFEAGGSSLESEVWADVEAVRTSFGDDAMNSVTVMLQSPSKYEGFETAVEQDKTAGLEVLREPVYYEKQSEMTADLLGKMGSVISVFFIIAAIIGAFITMNTAVAHRQREIGTLRALGFSRRAVLISFVLEGIILAVSGAVLGVVASIFLGFVTFSVINFATWSEVVFSFRLTPAIAMTAVIVGMITGLIGGIIPAARAARMKPIDALRA